MPALRKATLTPLTGDPEPREAGQSIEVQFNPSSLHLVIGNQVETTKAPSRPSEQQVGVGRTTLTLDLHFDTADEGTTDRPKNVREKTAQVAQFVLPTPGSTQGPPRVRFQWGDFVLVGVMSSFSEDLDLFSAQGVPLRAKVAVTIQGQNPEFAANRTGPGVGTGAGASLPGIGVGLTGSVGFGVGVSAGVGLSLGVGGTVGVGVGGAVGVSAGVGASLALGDRTEVALGGESAAEFAARVGVEPTAWRGVAAGLDSTVSIEAGVEIDFSSNLSTTAGVGLAGGVEAGRPSSPEAAVGLQADAKAPVVPGAAPGTAAGFALAAAGGVQAAVETVAIARSSSAAGESRAAFEPPPLAGEPASEPAAIAARGAAQAQSQPRPPLRGAPLALPGSRSDALPAPPRPRADPRATTFGFGVPLRPSVGGAAGERAGALQGWVLVRPRARHALQAPRTTDPTQAPWRELPAPEPTRAGAVLGAHQGGPCGCGGGCGCGGRRT